MTDFWKIFSTAVITAVASNIFGYLKDKKVGSTKYTEDVLKNLYVPVYKILIEDLDPSDGYEGINANQFYRIKKIIDGNPELCDPKLDGLVWSIDEDIRFDSRNYSSNPIDINVYDTDRKLIDYVLHGFNKTRKSLGLPTNILYVYPILYKIKYSKFSMWISYHKRKIKRRKKKIITKKKI